MLLCQLVKGGRRHSLEHADQLTGTAPVHKDTSSAVVPAGIRKSLDFVSESALSISRAEAKLMYSAHAACVQNDLILSTPRGITISVCVLTTVVRLRAIRSSASCFR